MTNEELIAKARDITPPVVSAVVIEPSLMGAHPGQVMTLVEGVVAAFCLAAEQVGRQMAAENYAAMLPHGGSAPDRDGPRGPA